MRYLNILSNLLKAFIQLTLAAMIIIGTVVLYSLCIALVVGFYVVVGKLIYEFALWIIGWMNILFGW